MGVVAVTLVLGVLGTMSSRAVAQPASAQAQSLFDEGRKLLAAGKLAEACTAFEASQKLDPAVTTLLNLADCREQNHQLATAWGAFVDANRMARNSGNDKLAKVATSHAKKLEPRLSKLTIAVPADSRIAGLEILRDADLVDPATWNHSLPIDGGSYTITARAPGRTPWSLTRTIKLEADSQTVDVPKLAEAKPAAVAAAPPVKTTPPPRTTTTPSTPPKSIAPPPAIRSGSAEPAPPVTRKPTTAAPTRVASTEPASGSTGGKPSEGGSSRYYAPIILGASALALGASAVIFNASGDSAYSDAGKATVQADQDRLYASANTRRYLAEGFGIAALGCAGAAIIVLYTNGRSPGRTETAMTPVVSPQFAGLSLAGSW